MAAQVSRIPIDFLGTADPRREREVEEALVDHIQRFLLEVPAEFKGSLPTVEEIEAELMRKRKKE